MRVCVCVCVCVVCVCAYSCGIDIFQRIHRHFPPDKR